MGFNSTFKGLKNALYLQDMKCETMWLYRILVLHYLYIACILVIRHTDEGHRSDRNMLVKKNSV